MFKEMKIVGGDYMSSQLVEIMLIQKGYGDQTVAGDVTYSYYFTDTDGNITVSNDYSVFKSSNLPEHKLLFNKEKGKLVFVPVGENKMELKAKYEIDGNEVEAVGEVEGVSLFCHRDKGDFGDEAIVYMVGKDNEVKGTIKVVTESVSKWGTLDIKVNIG